MRRMLIAAMVGAYIGALAWLAVEAWHALVRLMDVIRGL